MGLEDASELQPSGAAGVGLGRLRGRLGHVYPLRRRIGHIYPLARLRYGREGEAEGKIAEDR